MAELLSNHRLLSTKKI